VSVWTPAGEFYQPVDGEPKKPALSKAGPRIFLSAHVICWWSCCWL